MCVKAQDSKVHTPYEMRILHTFAKYSEGINYRYCALIENFLKEDAMDFFSK